MLRRLEGFWAAHIHPEIISNARAARSTAIAFIAIAAVFGVAPLAAQTLPSSIRGYKVHRKPIMVSSTSSDRSRSGEEQAVVTIGDPKLVDVGLTGINLELNAEIRALEQSGTVEFLTFHDFRVNEIPVEIDEYTASFKFRKNEAIVLPEPATIFLPTGRLIEAAYRELRDSKERWTVRGRVFVFGKFRRFGFHHKRVVPIDIDIEIANPLRSS